MEVVLLDLTTIWPVESLLNHRWTTAAVLWFRGPRMPQRQAMSPQKRENFFRHVGQMWMRPDCACLSFIQTKSFCVFLNINKNSENCHFVKMILRCEFRLHEIWSPNFKVRTLLDDGAAVYQVHLWNACWIILFSALTDAILPRSIFQAICIFTLWDLRQMPTVSQGCTWLQQTFRRMWPRQLLQFLT